MRMNTAGRRLVGILALLLSTGVAWGGEVSVLPGPLEPAGTGGIAALDRALAKLEANRRLLVIAAHPDDEDTSLLALVSQQGGEAAYLSLSRGEGGQNLIGEDLGVGLGVLRTQELLAARRLDGARQYFTRAHDFGYTRSLAETLERWPREALVEDVVRVIRDFKPQVVVSIFGEDGSGGHGQHQAAGWAAHEVYRRLAAGAAFPALDEEALKPWRPQALYRAAWFAPELATMKLSLAPLDPFAGRSIYQLAMASRSQHRSQDMGRLLEPGPRETRLSWVAGGAGKEGQEPFAGIDTRLAGIVAGLPIEASAAPLLARAAAAATALRGRLRPGDVAALVPDLAALGRDLLSAEAEAWRCADPRCFPAAQLLQEKTAIAGQALAIASGAVYDVAVDRETAVPGEQVKLTVTLWNSGARAIQVERIALETPGWGLSDLAGGERGVAPGEVAKWEATIAVPADAEPSQPYFLRDPLAGDLYDWSRVPHAWRGEPFGQPPLAARLTLWVEGAPAMLGREAVFRYGDQARGEIRRPLRLVPALEVDLEPDLVLLPQPQTPSRVVEVRLRSHAAQPLEGVLANVSECAALRTPEQTFRLAPRGQAVLALSARPCPGRERSPLAVEARLAGQVFRRSYKLLDYPHVPPVPLPHEARADAVAFDLTLPAVGPIGYVVGASDRLPRYLEEIGLPLSLLDAAALEQSDLARFGAIVVGARAYESEPALGRANGRLLDYARGGGLLLVQYQQYPYLEGKFAPRPFEIARPHGRITDENAPVTPLDPAFPLWLKPNRLGPDDWRGWVQERGLYFAASWQPGWVPLVEMRDPGEPAERGGLLATRLGRGLVVYSGLAFFRQLPAGVPGAYRLFANLLALRATAFAEVDRATRAGELTATATVADTHIDLPYRLIEKSADVARRTVEGDFDAPRARSGGLDLAWMSIYVPAELATDGAAKKKADELIDLVEKLVQEAPARFALARSVDEALAAERAGKIALPMGIENGSAIEHDLANLQHFYARGIRYITLTHSEDNPICDSSYSPVEKRKWRGLSPFGRAVIPEMNRLGILVDLSHVSDEAFDQAIALAQAPPIASHSSARHFTPGFERNLDDARIVALAKKGGVIQINFGSAFLTEAANRHSTAEWQAVGAFRKEMGLQDGDAKLDEFRVNYRKEHPFPRATLADVVAHIDHVAKLVGVDHVGLGSDFEGVGDSLPTGLQSVADYPNLTAALLAKGYSEADATKILGGNLLRVWREAERVARELQGKEGEVPRK